MFALMKPSETKRRFPPPWPIELGEDCYRVTDANGVVLAVVYFRDDLQRWSFGHRYLSSDEARRIAKGIARLPEFLMSRHGFYSREGGHPRWRKSRPYHVALEDSYIRAHWPTIEAVCKLNNIPFDPTGEKIQRGGLWCVHEFKWQLDAILFWARFEGRWLVGGEFIYPERPKDLPKLKEPGGPPFDPKYAR